MRNTHTCEFDAQVASVSTNIIAVVFSFASLLLLIYCARHDVNGEYALIFYGSVIITLQLKQGKRKEIAKWLRFFSQLSAASLTRKETEEKDWKPGKLLKVQFLLLCTWKIALEKRMRKNEHILLPFSKKFREKDWLQLQVLTKQSTLVFARALSRLHEILACNLSSSSALAYIYIWRDTEGEREIPWTMSYKWRKFQSSFFRLFLFILLVH